MTSDFYSTYASFIGAASIGVIFGLLYDVFRILRIARLPYIVPEGRFYDFIKIPQVKGKCRQSKLKKILHLSGNIVTFTEDIIFWILISFGEILFIYHINGGEIRIYYFLLTFAGAALYFLTVGKCMMYFSVRIIFLIRCLLYWVFYIIIYPIRKTLSFLKKLALFSIKKTIRPIISKVRINADSRYSKKRISSVLDQSKNGFYYVSEYVK